MTVAGLPAAALLVTDSISARTSRYGIQVVVPGLFVDLNVCKRTLMGAFTNITHTGEIPSVGQLKNKK